MLQVILRAVSVVVLVAAFGGELPAQTVREGYVTGVAVKASGEPLGGVRIRVFGTTDAGQRSSLNVRTKADGTFALRLPPGQFSVREANWTTNYNGRAYSLPLYLEGEDNEDFDSTEGAAVRLVLKMAGKVAATKSDTDERAWFGGTIELEFINSDGTSADSLPENAKLTVELTPTGTLMDGSPARALSYAKALNWQRANRFILDVPLADYEVKAGLDAGGGVVPLLVSSRETVGAQTKTPLAKTAPVTFAPGSGDVTLMGGSGVVKSVVQVVIPAKGAVSAATSAAGGSDGARGGVDVGAAGPGAKWKVGDRVNVLRTPRLEQWHTGQIRAVKDGLYLIKFDAFEEEQNEWVDESRVKRL